MSQGTPNIRVGLEVQIFGTTQMGRAQKALKELGLSIETVDNRLVNVNGNQTRYHKGIVTLTARTKESREEQAKAAKAAIETATANAEVASQVKKTTDAVTQITSGLKKQQTQNEKTQQAATNLANHTAKVTATANAKVTENREKTNNALRLLDEKDFNSYREHIRKIVFERLRSNNKIAEDGSKTQNSLTLVRTREEEKRETQHRNHLNRIEAMERNHQLTLQRMQQGGGIGGMFGGIGNVGRVIAYDMLRRTITNIYQSVWRVAEALGQWTIESINFNDELARAQTVFTGLGLIGTRNNEGGPMTIPQAEVSTDPKVQEVLRKAQEGSDKMMRGLIEITALTGSDMDEVVSSARQILPDLINKRSKAGMPNPYLQNPDELNMITQQMVKLASVLKMSDPGGRPLKWHMVALQELFSGTSGGGKDKGREAVRSLRAREGIKMTDEEASTLAKAVNTGDLVKASQIIEATLERSGQGLQNLSNLLSKTLKPNVDGTITALRLFGKSFTEVLHRDLIADFTAIRISLFDIFEDPRFKTGMTALSGMFAESFKDIRDTVFRYLDMIHKNPQEALKKLEPIITNFRQGMTVLRYAIEAIGLFIMGFFNSDLGMENLTLSMQQLRDSAYENGRQMSITVKSINDFSTSMTPVMNTISSIAPIANRVFTIVLIGISYVLEIVQNLLASLLSLVPGRFLSDTIRRQRDERLRTGAQYPETLKLIRSLELQSGALPPIPEPPPATTPPATTPPVAPPNLALQPPPGASTPLNSLWSTITGQPIGGRAVQAGTTGNPNNRMNNPNIQLNDNAVVEGFRVARPMRFEPRRMDQHVSVSIGEVRLTTNNAQNFIDQLVNLGRGNIPRPRQTIQGPYSFDAAAQRGLRYDN